MNWTILPLSSFIMRCLSSDSHECEPLSCSVPYFLFNNITFINLEHEDRQLYFALLYHICWKWTPLNGLCLWRPSHANWWDQHICLSVCLSVCRCGTLWVVGNGPLLYCLLSLVLLTSRHEFIYQTILYIRLWNCDCTDLISDHSVKSCFTLYYYVCLRTVLSSELSLCILSVPVCGKCGPRFVYVSLVPLFK